MAFHSRFARGSQRPARQMWPAGTLRSGASLLVSALIGLMFMVVADAHARGIEYLREAGVATDGTITGLHVLTNGGRNAYWMRGTYRAVSLAGRDLTLPFDINISAEEYATLAAGQAVRLLYDPERPRDPVLAEEVSAFDTTAIRLISAGAAGVYLAIGAGLSLADWRRRARRSRRSAALRRVFGTR